MVKVPEGDASVSVSVLGETEQIVFLLPLTKPTEMLAVTAASVVVKLVQVYPPSPV